MKISRNTILAGTAVALAIGVALFFSFKTEPEPIETVGIVLLDQEPQVVALGQQVYADNCASCHGVNLEGQPNWRSPGPDGLLPAPPHDETGHTWHHVDELLFGLTKYGVAKMIGNPNQKSGMPAYEGVLSDDEIIAALSYIKSTWPADVRVRHDQMNAQHRDSKKKQGAS